MIDVKDNEGEISYNVNLYSEVIAFADTLKELTFSDLGFTELAHDYNKTEINRSWNDHTLGITYLNPSTSGFRDAFSTLKYPFINWTGQINIALAGGNPTAGNPELPTLESAFRPCIQLKYLINRIFSASEFNFTSNFFNEPDFEKLYMDFNWGADNTPNDYELSGTAIRTAAVIYEVPVSWTTIATDTNDFSSEFGYNNSTGFTALTSNATYNVEFTALYLGDNGAKIANRILHTEAATGNTFVHSYTEYEWTGYNDITDVKNISIQLNSGDTLEYQAIALASIYFPPPVDLTLPSIPVTAAGGWTTQTLATISIDVMTTSVMLQTLRGETGQWDFLKGIMTMFNLVSMVDETNPNNILIEPYGDVLLTNSDSKRLDWTDKVDVSEMELKPLTDLNKTTIFQFVEDEDDYTFRQFKNSTSGHLYGSKKLDASLSATNNMPTMLQGTKKIIAEPFAATVSKPLFDQFTNFVIPEIFAKNNDGNNEGFDNSPRIFYNNGIKSTGASYFIPAQNGVAWENEANFLQFSHLSTIPSFSATTLDYVFESGQLFPGVAGTSVGGGGAPAANLYSLYWQPYFNELYHEDTRVMTLKVNLSPTDVASFKFYDTVFIKNRAFRVNKIDYKPNSLATVEFILIP